MSLTLRLFLAAMLLGLLGLGAFALLGEKAEQPEPGAEIVRFTSSRQCKECHEDVFNEWFGSHHQISFVNPELRKAGGDDFNKDCEACHLPRPVFETGIGQRPLPRMTRPDEGVDCLTCHQAADGGILGRHSFPQAPCRPRADTTFVKMDVCETCHNQHQTTDQWRASKYPALGITCNTCHMPEVERRKGERTNIGFHHGFPGAHDTAMLKRAATFDVKVDGTELVATVTNVGAGHNFPTEERHRAVDVVVRFETADGVAQWQRVWRFRQPYRDELGENTQLPAGESKEVRIKIPERATRVDARMIYKLTPFVTDDDGTLLAEHRILF